MTTASTSERVDFFQNNILKVTAVVFLSIWSWTLIDVADMTNWLLENIPVFFLVIILVATYRKFQFSDLSYILMVVFLAMHIYGAKHIYASNPLGFWLQETFNTSRNHYDRIVHFSFGFFISYAIRDLCLNYFKATNNVSLLVTVICSLALGALYEILEGAIVGIFFPEQGANFLGIQGDFWDAQKDMFLEFFSSICFVVCIKVVYAIKKTRTLTSPIQNKQSIV